MLPADRPSTEPSKPFRDFGAVAVILGLAAWAADALAPPGWDLARWGNGLLMLGGPSLLFQVWIDDRRARFRQEAGSSPAGASSTDPDTLPSESTEPE